MKPVTQMICFHVEDFIELDDKARLRVHLIVAGLALCSVEDKDSTSSKHGIFPAEINMRMRGYCTCWRGYCLAS